MAKRGANVTTITEFLLLGLPEGRAQQVLCATLFLLIYLVALTGNLLIIALTTLERRLQTPMYFFLKNLSLIDICYVSVTAPQTIMNSLTNSRSISVLGCASQVFLIIVFAGTELALLLVMSHDRYVAICRPLHYEAVMCRGACVRAVSAAWLSGCVYGSLHTTGTFSVHFCGPNVLPLLFCDVPSLLVLACSGEQSLEYAFLIASFALAFFCFLFMVASYVHIFLAVLRIPSAHGRLKTFSTCMPHLMVVTLFLCAGSVSYFGTTYDSVSPQNLLMSVVYSMLPPSLNPLIYSLRNKHMKEALGKLLRGQLSAKL
ncbi:olfactory receptor 14A16-like [Ochotona curzoniae]|uniref:olfactory receptor 14A16-like n=1 Tax=Ochotona curzoniae TaxID=130825 RepID=UPI001B349F46|nr:olfactory receptor 14A16-like [Ochotona curzoniae]